MRLVNEKTLELNIIHQYLNLYRSSRRSSFAVGETLQSEKRSGIDSWVKTPYRTFLFQFKAPRTGADGVSGQFFINTNKGNDQHNKLLALSHYFKESVYYVFPLVISDKFFEEHAGNLIPYTIFEKPEDLIPSSTAAPHEVVVGNTGECVAHSDEFKSEGITSDQFFQLLLSQDIGISISPETYAPIRLIEQIRKVLHENFPDSLPSLPLGLAFFHPTNPMIYASRF